MQSEKCSSLDLTLFVLQLIIEFPPSVTEQGTGLHIYFLFEPMQFLIIPLLIS